MLHGVLLAATDPGNNVGDVSGLVGLLNYGVLGILTLGFIRGWVVSPRERDRLSQTVEDQNKKLNEKDAEIARLNTAMQEQLKAMVANTDRQIELWTRRTSATADRGQSGRD